MTQPLTISIIDDDISVRTALSGIVRSMDLAALTFDSAQKFLSSASLKSTACIIADVHMPGMSGIELQHALIAKNIKMPMVFITAFPDERVRAKALEEGAICFLDKPFDGSTMIECIELALGARKNLSV